MPLFVLHYDCQGAAPGEVVKGRSPNSIPSQVSCPQMPVTLGQVGSKRSSDLVEVEYVLSPAIV